MVIQGELTLKFFQCWAFGTTSIKRPFRVWLWRAFWAVLVFNTSKPVSFRNYCKIETRWCLADNLSNWTARLFFSPVLLESEIWNWYKTKLAKRGWIRKYLVRNERNLGKNYRSASINRNQLYSRKYDVGKSVFSLPLYRRKKSGENFQKNCKKSSA